MTKWINRTAAFIPMLVVLMLAAPAPAETNGEQAKKENAKLEVGEAAPAFELKDLEGKTHKLSDYRGKIVVLHFQAINCPWERAYQAGLNRVAEQYKEVERDDETVKVQFFGVNANYNESIDALRSTREERDIPYPILKDHGNKVADLYAARTTPHIYIIDQEGVLRYMGGVEKAPISPNRVWQSDEQYLEPVLQAVTAGEASPFDKTVSKGCVIKRAN